MDIKVCGVCGSGSNSALIVKCVRCNDYEHRYCMKVVARVSPQEWYCAKCQEHTNRGPKPSQGGQTELQKPCHGRDMTSERETSKLHLSQSSVVHQIISPKSLNRFENAKVKFISSEEVALLSRERPPSVTSRFTLSQPSKASSPPTTKHLSNMNCVSPSRSDKNVQALKRCADASHSQAELEDRSYSAMQQRRVHPASPSSMKQPSNMKSTSPGRRDMQVQNQKRYAPMRESQPHVKQLSNRTATQVHATKRSATSSHDQANIDDINMDCEARSGGSVPMMHECRTSESVKVKMDSLIEHKAREKKIVNADKGEIKSQTELEPREKGTLCTSEIGSLNQNKDVIVTMVSTVQYSRRPAPTNCWRGCFHVFNAGEKLNLGEFKAYFPSKVSSRVIDIVKMMPTVLQLELLHRMDDWPKSFETMHPVHEDIGLFFFPNKPDG
ncbi:hypothetical protein Zm00014a_026664 [Zea mays]|uniref:PHD-type domain-containing protein n=1 Tax=Zea mays TaxID=4577 RepID=A0A317Y535_MAIZE|nr:hypothetical protein Zm00014a_026664 [Zea mays]